ncbi:hypothetical protein IFR05_004106 [Cadophora sp. M221]|nr:hypothetical protein IFR05_004106 [Cadophora sp. M221]
MGDNKEWPASEPVEVGSSEAVNRSMWNRVKGKASISVDGSRMDPGSKWPNKVVTYWISDAFAVLNWRIRSSLIAIGLSWKLALVAVAIGNFITALVGTYTGAECIQSMIFAIWSRFQNVPNQLSESANITTRFMICYFIYWVVRLPFHYISPHQVRWFLTFKSIVTTIAGFTIVGFLVSSAGGGEAIFSQSNQVHGSKLGWAMMNGIYAMVGNFATLGVNMFAPLLNLFVQGSDMHMNDFARYSKKPSSPYIQLLVISIVFIVMMLFGIIGANRSKILHGEQLWDPLLIVDNWTSKGGTAAAFFCAFAFPIASIGVNISANSISVATDLSVLLARYINIRRGQFIYAIIGAWAMTPWNILVFAESLVNFMSGHKIWLAPISGILIVDYWVVHRQVLSVPDVYRPDGIYAYNKYGTNWRAVIAFFVGFVPLLPGFAKSLGNPSTTGEK